MYVSTILIHNKRKNIKSMQLNSHEKQYKLFMFDNLENAMRGYHI